MANTSTLLQTLQVSFPQGARGGFSQVKQYAVAFDTLAADLTIHTTTAGKVAVVVGLKYSEAAAHSLTWKSAANVIVTLECAANTVVSEGLHTAQGATILTKAGENLVAQVNTAVINSLVVYVAELDSGLFLG